MSQILFGLFHTLLFFFLSSKFSKALKLKNISYIGAGGGVVW